MDRTYGETAYTNGTVTRTGDYKDYNITNPTSRHVAVSNGACALTKPVTIRSVFSGSSSIAYNDAFLSVYIRSSRVEGLSEGSFFNDSKIEWFGQQEPKSFAVVFDNSAPSKEAKVGWGLDDKFPFFKKMGPKDYQDIFARNVVQRLNGGVNEADILEQNTSNITRHGQNLKLAGVVCTGDVTLTPGDMVDLALGNLGHRESQDQKVNDEGRFRQNFAQRSREGR